MLSHSAVLLWWRVVSPHPLGSSTETPASPPRWLSFLSPWMPCCIQDPHYASLPFQLFPSASLWALVSFLSLNSEQQQQKSLPWFHIISLSLSHSQPTHLCRVPCPPSHSALKELSGFAVSTCSPSCHSSAYSLVFDAHNTEGQGHYLWPPWPQP